MYSSLAQRQIQLYQFCVRLRFIALRQAHAICADAFNVATALLSRSGVDRNLGLRI